MGSTVPKRKTQMKGINDQIVGGSWTCFTNIAWEIKNTPVDYYRSFYYVGQRGNYKYRQWAELLTNQYNHIGYIFHGSSDLVNGLTKAHDRNI